MLVQKRFSQMGFISTAAIAAAPAFGPAAPIVIAVAIIASFLPFIGFGAGRTEADYLTKPGQGAQWLLEHVALPNLVDPYTAIKESGNLTIEYLDNLVTGLEYLRDGFVAYVKNADLKRAGPGAIATIVHVINDLIIPDVLAHYTKVKNPQPNIEQPIDIQEFLPVSGSVPVTLETQHPHPVIHVVSSGFDWTPLVIMLAFALASNLKKG